MSRLHRRQLLQYSSLAIASAVVSACTGGRSDSGSSATNSSPVVSPAGAKLDAVTFATNWYAQAEHGGFYQAVATGIYKQHGLDVTIKMGGPQINGTQLLMGKAIDFFMGFGSAALKAVESGIPTVAVAAIFQKDPQILVVHPNTGVKTLADLKGRPILVSASANTTYWPFLKAKYGFTDDQKRPYNFNMGPFLADKTVAQQGYLSSEPLKIKKQGGFEPQVFLLADNGYTPYSTTIETRKELVQQNPDLVQRFVDASIKGWYSYFKDPAPANALIKKDNPEMTDDQIAYGIAKMQEYGIVISGDAEKLGIGAMTEVRWKTFFDSMVQEGILKPDTNYKDAFTLQFVNKGTQAYQS